MVSLFGRGFDSLQLHKRYNTNANNKNEKTGNDLE